MGTRADFYIGRGKTAQWIGSIAWDGHPDSHAKALWGIKSAAKFKREVGKIIAGNDGTTPDMGWPWPWENSDTTDYAYAFDKGRVWGTCFGHGWNHIEAKRYKEGAKNCDFPKMDTSNMAPAGSHRSGVMVFSVKP